MTESRCPLCGGDNLAQKLRDENYQLRLRLQRAKDVFNDLKPRAEREALYEDALHQVYDRLRRMRITKGAFVHDLKDDLETAKKIIVEALRS
jgi:hypothetical protein